MPPKLTRADIHAHINQTHKSGVTAGFHGTASLWDYMHEYERIPRIFPLLHRDEVQKFIGILTHRRTLTAAKVASQHHILSATHVDDRNFAESSIHTQLTQATQQLEASPHTQLLAMDINCLIIFIEEETPNKLLDFLHAQKKHDILLVGKSPDDYLRLQSLLISPQMLPLRELIEQMAYVSTEAVLYEVDLIDLYVQLAKKSYFPIHYWSANPGECTIGSQAFHFDILPSPTLFGDALPLFPQQQIANLASRLTTQTADALLIIDATMLEALDAAVLAAIAAQGYKIVIAAKDECHDQIYPVIYLAPEASIPKLAIQIAEQLSLKGPLVALSQDEDTARHYLGPVIVDSLEAASSALQTPTADETSFVNIRSIVAQAKPSTLAADDTPSQDNVLAFIMAAICLITAQHQLVGKNLSEALAIQREWLSRIEYRTAGTRFNCAELSLEQQINALAEKMIVAAKALKLTQLTAVFQDYDGSMCVAGGPHAGPWSAWREVYQKIKAANPNLFRILCTTRGNFSEINDPVFADMLKHMMPDGFDASLFLTWSTRKAYVIAKLTQILRKHCIALKCLLLDDNPEEIYAAQVVEKKLAQSSSLSTHQIVPCRNETDFQQAPFIQALLRHTAPEPAAPPPLPVTIHRYSSSDLAFWQSLGFPPPAALSGDLKLDGDAAVGPAGAVLAEAEDTTPISSRPGTPP